MKDKLTTDHLRMIMAGAKTCAEKMKISEDNPAYELIIPAEFGVDFSDAIVTALTGSDEFYTSDIAASNLINKVLSVALSGKIPLLLITLVGSINFTVPLSVVNIQSDDGTEQDNVVIFDIEFGMFDSWLSGGVAVMSDTITVRNNMANNSQNQDSVTHTELETGLSKKADVATAATKTELQTGLSKKADAATAATKTELQTGLSKKADAATAVTKSELQTELGENIAYCIKWTSSEVLPYANWYRIAYGKKTFVAVEYDGSHVAYSTDCATWTETTMPFSARWVGITYGNDKFVAVAENSNQAAYSDDGNTWIAATLPSSAMWKSVAYGNGKFVAVALDSDKATYSTDGINWVETTLPSSAGWSGIAHNGSSDNSKFVAVAQNSDKAAYSSDGVSWTETTLPSSKNWSSIACSYGTFAVVAYGSNKAAYSYNGIHWWEKSMPSTGKWVCVAGGRGGFVAVAEESNKAAYSTNGITWTESILTYRLNWNGVAYGDGKFIAVTTGRGFNIGSPLATVSQLQTELSKKQDVSTAVTKDNVLSVMKNYMEWTSSTLPSSKNWEGIAYGGGRFVAVAGSSKGAAYSEDGKHWTKATTISYKCGATSIAYGNGKFVAVSRHIGNKSIYSEDGGATWAEATLPSSASWEGIAYGCGRFVAVAGENAGAAYSDDDGKTWTAAVFPSSGMWWSITYGDGRFVAVGNGKAAYSDDGITWTETTIYSSGLWYDVAYGSGKFVAVDYGGKNFSYSEDGITWILETPLFSEPWSESWYNVAYGGGRFVASVGLNKAAYSTDGINWILGTLPDHIYAGAIAYGNGKFVTVEYQSDTAGIGSPLVTMEEMESAISEAIGNVGGAGNGDSIPSGVIAMWSGTADAIPTGWALCDGTNGTPDLRDRFVLGAGNKYVVGTTGGSEEIALAVEQIPEHSHSITKLSVSPIDSSVLSSGTDKKFVQTIDLLNMESTSTGSTGSSQPHSNMPPYYALCYIMRL